MRRCSAALLCALAALHAPARSGAHDAPRFVVVFATHESRAADLVSAGRDTWRGATPTVIVTDGASEGAIDAPAGAGASERWFSYPDGDAAASAGGAPGDRRAAAALRIANHTHADAYDWLAFGHDDTVFMLDAARALVQGLDPSVPYLLSDVASCVPGRGCKAAGTGLMCSLPRNAERAADAEAEQAVDPPWCAAAPPAAPCLNTSLLGAAGVCAPPPPPRAPFAWPCVRHGALLSRGALRLLDEATWRARCEGAAESSSSPGGAPRAFACLWREAGLGMTDPTPSPPEGAEAEHPFCALGGSLPSALLATARDAARNGTCDGACDRALHRTVSLAVDAAAGEAGSAAAAAAIVRKLHAAISEADTAVAAALAAALPHDANADADALAAELWAAGVEGPFVATLTTGNHHRWRLFLNWLAHAAPLQLPLVVFCTDAATRLQCGRAVEGARAALHAPPPALCFFPEASLSRFDPGPLGTTPGADAAWRRALAIAKPLALALAVSAGEDVAFVETDVILRGDLLAELAERDAVVSVMCGGSPTPPRGAPMPGDANVGVLYLRADARVPPLLHALLLRPGGAEDLQAELLAALRAVQPEAAKEAYPFADCVGAAEGFTTTCCGYNPTAKFAVHVAGAAASGTEGKIAWMHENGLWRPPLRPATPPPWPPPRPYPPSPPPRPPSPPPPLSPPPSPPPPSPPPRA